MDTINDMREGESHTLKPHVIGRSKSFSSTSTSSDLQCEQPPMVRSNSLRPDLECEEPHMVRRTSLRPKFSSEKDIELQFPRSSNKLFKFNKLQEPEDEIDCGSQGKNGPSIPTLENEPSVMQVTIQVMFMLGGLVTAAVADVATGSYSHRRPLWTPTVGIAEAVISALQPIRLAGIPFDMRTIPPFTVIVMVLVGMPYEVVVWAIYGTVELCPLQIMVIFFGMAYICLSVDETGVLKHVALIAAARTNSPLTVFIVVTGLTGAMTLLTSNDIVILTLTPIIIHLCNAKGYDPFPFLYLEFFTANVWSIALVIGNPTNVIVAGAAHLLFAEYAAKLAPIGIVAGITAVITIYIRFRSILQEPALKEIQNPENLPPDEPEVPLSRIRAMFTSGRLIALLLFAACDIVHRVPLWFSVFFVTIFALCMDWIMDKASTDGVTGTVCNTIRRMPWEVLFFALSLFVMVEALDHAGTVAWLAQTLAAFAKHGIFTASFGVGFLAILACQLLNNQPMTVLFTKVLLHPKFLVGPVERSVAFSALIIGSNLGANLTLIGALAGPMWASLIRQLGLEMGNKSFFVRMICLTPPVATVTFLALALEMAVIHMF